MSNPQQSAFWNRRRQQEPAQPDIQDDMPVMLSERMAPFLRECDQALFDNRRLREENDHLRNELRHSQAMQDSAADRIDVLEEEAAIIAKEVSLYRARLKMFGEAAQAIVKQVEEEAKTTFEPKPRESFQPAPGFATRPVRPIIAAAAVDDADLSPALLFLRGAGTHG